MKTTMWNPHLLGVLANLVLGVGGTQQIPLESQTSNKDQDVPHFGELPLLTAGLEEYIEDVMDRWHAPGMAVAVINGEDTWAKGFGYGTLEPPMPVTPHTLFWTGSTTKSFTAAGLSLLIDNSSEYSGVRWETPISQLLREDFVLSDDWATEHITIEDALCHRTGYPRHDLAIGNSSLGTVRKLRHLPMSAEPRTKFQYNNMMWNVAGVLISSLTGLDLSAFFHKHLWTPMGMNETFLATYDPLFEPSGQYLADGYMWDKRAGVYVKTDEAGELMRGDEGAGAILSNVLDYSKYLRVMMAEGGPMSKKGHRELKRPRTIHNMNAEMFGPAPLFYGLGWMGTVFEGEQIYWHTGTNVPFVTFMVIVPARGYGIVTMANSWSKVRELVTYRILYDLFGVDEERRRDFEKLFTEQEEAERKYLATCPERLYPHVPSPPLPASRPLTSHEGHYRHQAYSSIFVTLDCGGEGTNLPRLSTIVEDEGCELHMANGPDSQAQFGGKLTHVTGDFWLAHALYVLDVGVCVRAQFRVDVSGSVVSIGVDVRGEEEDTPLVWFDRVE